jgi:hypothetical protein
MTFKVTPSFKKRFRQTALDENLRLNELLIKLLEHYHTTRAQT